MKNVIVSAIFDNLTSRNIRFLEEASRFGELHVLLWSDAAVEAVTGQTPRFPLVERDYFVQAVRFVSQVHFSDDWVRSDALPAIEGFVPDIWVSDQAGDSAARREYCAANGIEYRVLKDEDYAGFPAAEADVPSGKTKVIVTGCYDLFHTGHVRFFEETSALGDLYVVVGQDANIRLLKGEGRPLFKQDERRYIAGSLRYVKQALISSGSGWMDAAPEIAVLQPDIYAVNEDGDVPEKREFCLAHGIKYVVLKRTPKPGLTQRSSTALRKS